MKDWTPEDDATILRLLSQGRARRQIGAHFGVTRNAICGRVDRLKKKIESATPNADTIAAFVEVEMGGGELFEGPTEDAMLSILESPDEPQKIVAGSRVVWSAIGRETIKHFHNRNLPKDGVFIVEQVVEWKMSKASVRIRGFKSPMYLEEFELAAV